MTTEYVMGFCTNSHGQVVLVRKRASDPSRAGLNGPGGKVEEGESIERAMAREWSEETGYEAVGWERYGDLRGDSDGGPWIVHLFRARTNELVLETNPTMVVSHPYLQTVLMGGELCPWALTALALSLERFRGGSGPMPVIDVKDLM
jgi:8-oxo-dGTP pyrophosphatase MutT (NUDIX family)